MGIYDLWVRGANGGKQGGSRWERSRREKRSKGSHRAEVGVM